MIRPRLVKNNVGASDATQGRMKEKYEEAEDFIKQKRCNTNGMILTWNLQWPWR